MTINTLSHHRCQKCHQVKKPGTEMFVSLELDETTGFAVHRYQCVKCGQSVRAQAWTERKDNITLPDLGSWNRRR